MYTGNQTHKTRILTLKNYQLHLPNQIWVKNIYFIIYISDHLALGSFLKISEKYKKCANLEAFINSIGLQKIYKFCITACLFKVGVIIIIIIVQASKITFNLLTTYSYIIIYLLKPKIKIITKLLTQTFIIKSKSNAIILFTL